MSAKTLIVIGSGGHTAEILKLMSCMSEQQYRPRMWVVANTDRLGASKAAAFEERAGSATRDYDVQLIPRSRHVGQSFITSIWTTMYSFFFAFVLVWRFRPNLVLVNGPGTCIPICVAAALLRLVGLLAVKIVYVESIARVTRLSLSARILYYSRIADLLLVQWPDLQKRYPRSKYRGRLY